MDAVDDIIPSRPSRIALLLRAYEDNAKTAHLAEQLSSISGAELFICADTTNGPVKIGNFCHIEYSLERFKSLGLRVAIEGGPQRCLWFCGDYSAYPALLDLPEFDYFFLIEYDVFFSEGGLRWLEDFCNWLQVFPTNRFDCFAPNINFNAPPAWHWHAHAQRVGEFDNVSMLLFSMLAISKAAAAYLYSMRLIEAVKAQIKFERGIDRSGAVSFCEYFVPSSLRRNSDFKFLQLKDLPSALGRLDLRHFTSNRPILFERSLRSPDVGDIAHPVVEVEQYLRKITSIFKGDKSPFPQTRWILANESAVPLGVSATREYGELIRQAKDRLRDVDHFGGS